jgi:hypothetical protein
VKKILLGVIVAAVAVAIAVPVAFGGPGATVTKTCNPANALPGHTGCDFTMLDGTGTWVTYSPSAYNDVITPSGNENEHFEGSGITNNTGADVILNAANTTVPTCYSFTTKNTTPNWQLVIHADGTYTLDCAFSK